MQDISQGRFLEASSTIFIVKKVLPPLLFAIYLGWQWLYHSRMVASGDTRNSTECQEDKCTAAYELVTMAFHRASRHQMTLTNLCICLARLADSGLKLYGRRMTKAYLIWFLGHLPDHFQLIPQSKNMNEVVVTWLDPPNVPLPCQNASVDRVLTSNTANGVDPAVTNGQ
ncbi:hypothetical protein M514_10379 [Trichuris suis]|uniref:Uncharacterized protein n=1 Tax=Trichuris suis TaxID=68888 RepID=A0A085NEK2_9BILA|nr:hypothetical protein M514_10379 [Trichuris suis]